MTRLISAITLAMVISGCAMLPRVGDSTPPYVSLQRKKLSQAVDQVKAGNPGAATKLLNAICREKSIPGITDEALFRLGLLTLDRESGLNALERLQKEYPASIWAKTAAPVVDMLTQNDELRSQNRTLRSSNQAAMRENKELLQNIERLKSLDIELERKTKPPR